MKKLLTAGAILASIFSLPAHSMLYWCSHTAPNGFVSKNEAFRLNMNDSLSGYVIFDGLTYSFDNMNDLSNGVYNELGTATVAVGKLDAAGNKASLLYKDANKEVNYTCALDQQDLQNEIALDKAEKAAAKKKAEAEAARAKKQADEAAREDAEEARKTPEQRAKEKAEASAGVDDLLGDLSGGKNTPKTPPKKPVTSGANMADVSQYTQHIAAAVRSQVEGWDGYKGKSCSVQIHMAQDGTLTSVDKISGDEDFCAVTLEGLNKLGKLPKPPTESIYNIFKDANLNLKP
ncbi:cell envelope integrity protein TolA [Citrobacter freundii]|nr:cell envelope integrity protein TolA [Citrobacter freundii]